MSSRISDDVLDLLRSRGPMTREMISSELGLGETSVRQAIQCLLDWGRIRGEGREQHPYPRRGGRARIWRAL